MKPGDLIEVHTTPTGSVKPAIVVEISDDGYIRVLLEGHVMWVPASFTTWRVTFQDPVQPTGGVVR